MFWLRQTGLFALWLALIVAGRYVIFQYASSSTPSAKATDAFPAAAPLVLDDARPTLVMFAHPKCPCTRASLAELTRILTQCTGELATRIVFVRPEPFEPGWEETDLWQSAERLPDVEIIVDPAGKVADLFGARTSGETFLYDTGGQLVFHGGITASRGHEGDNAGRQAIISYVQPGKTGCATTKVFGCALLDR
jgi:hypothetical protein